MNNISSYYTKYTNHIGEYNQWLKEQEPPPCNISETRKEALKRKAEAIAEPILLADSYTHDKAEDSETFYQTYNTELMSVTGLLCTLPLAITKAVPFLSKHADKNNAAKKAFELLSKYKNKSFNIAGRNISLPYITTIISSLGAAVFFAKGIKKSVEGQLGLIRKASFDATQTIINNPKIFAVLTPEQETELQSILNHQRTYKTGFVDRLKDRIDVSSSFQSVKEYNKTNKDYQKKKSRYFEEINNISGKNPSAGQMEIAKEDSLLFRNYLKSVEHDVLEPLRKVETIANISYSALFAGGFLEYLITDKLADVLHVKSKPVQILMKIGIPILTYLLLNKNISDFENKAILAIKYKHLKKFTENPEQYGAPEEKDKNIISFMKTVIKDMKDYDTFAEKELPKIKEKLEAKQNIKLSPKQEQQASLLQKNTSMTINTLKERFFEQTVGIEALSEIITNPIDILGTAIGGKIGNTLAKRCNPRYKGLMTAIGTIAGFIPIAVMEAKFTKQQKIAEKISIMLAMKDLESPKKFAEDNSYVNESRLINEIPHIFNEFYKSDYIAAREV